MPAVRIVFDRLRLEEKMLLKEAENMNCDASMLDAKKMVLGTEARRQNLDLGDVVLERCISYVRGLHVTACLEFLGVPVINSAETASRCGNKAFMSLALKKCGVPTPATSIAFTPEAARETAEGGRTVLKPVVGSWGRGIVPLRDEATVEAALEVRGVRDGAYDRIYYLQRIVERPPRDIRVITVGGEAVAAMYRESDGFTSNVATGAEPVKCPISAELAELAARASEASGGGILGIDMMEDKERGLVVHEVNNTVEFRGLASVSEANIPRRMIQYALSEARK